MPSPSPTITSAVKLNRRPPLTTLATRLIATTRSMYAVLSPPCPRRSSRPRDRSPPPVRRWAPLMFLVLLLVSRQVSGRGCRSTCLGQLVQNDRPPSRAPSASPATLPWYLLPARSKTTLSIPAAFARSATTSPTRLARADLSPSTERSSASIVLADTRVRPAVSSTTCAVMCFDDLVTTRRGRSGVPATSLRTRACRRSRADVRADVCLLCLSAIAMATSLPFRPCGGP